MRYLFEESNLSLLADIIANHQIDAIDHEIRNIAVSLRNSSSEKELTDKRYRLHVCETARAFKLINPLVDSQWRMSLFCYESLMQFFLDQAENEVCERFSDLPIGIKKNEINAVRCWYLQLDSVLQEMNFSQVNPLGLVVLGKAFFAEPLKFCAFISWLLRNGISHKTIVDTNLLHHYFAYQSFDVAEIQKTYQLLYFLYPCLEFSNYLGVEPCQMRGFTNSALAELYLSRNLKGGFLVHEEPERVVSELPPLQSSVLGNVSPELTAKLYRLFGWGLLGDLSLTNRDAYHSQILTCIIESDICEDFFSDFEQKVLNGEISSKYANFVLDRIRFCRSDREFLYAIIKKFPFYLHVLFDPIVEAPDVVRAAVARITTEIRYHTMTHFPLLVSLYQNLSYFYGHDDGIERANSDFSDSDFSDSDFDADSNEIQTVSEVTEYTAIEEDDDELELEDYQQESAAILQLIFNILFASLNSLNDVFVASIFQIHAELKPLFKQRLEFLSEKMNESMARYTTDPDRSFDEVHNLWIEQLSQFNLINHSYPDLVSACYYPPSKYALFVTVTEYAFSDYETKRLVARWSADDEEATDMPNFFVYDQLKRMGVSESQRMRVLQEIIVLSKKYELIQKVVTEVISQESPEFISAFFYDEFGDGKNLIRHWVGKFHGARLDWFFYQLTPNESQLFQSCHWFLRIKRSDLILHFLDSMNVSQGFITSLLQKIIHEENPGAVKEVLLRLASFLDNSLFSRSLLVELLKYVVRNNSPDLLIRLLHQEGVELKSNELRQLFAFTMKAKCIVVLKLLCGFFQSEDDAMQLSNTIIQPNNVILYLEVLENENQRLLSVEFLDCLTMKAFLKVRNHKKENLLHMAARHANLAVFTHYIRFFKTYLPRELSSLLHEKSSSGDVPQALGDSADAREINQQLQALRHASPEGGSQGLFARRSKRSRADSGIDNASRSSSETEDEIDVIPHPGPSQPRP